MEIRMPVLLSVMIYVLVVAITTGIIEARRAKYGKDQFALAGRSMGPWGVGLTSGLAVLGAVHVLGFLKWLGL